MDEAPLRARSASACLLAVGVVGALGVAVLPGVAGLTLRLALVLTGVAAVAVGARRHRPRRMRPWGLVLAGLTASAAGDVLVLLTTLRGPVSGNLPTDAWLTVVAGALLLAGVIDATRGARGRDLGGAVDAAIIALAGGTVVWQVLVVPAAAPGWTGTGTETAGSLQVLLLLVATGMVVRAGSGLPRGQRTAAALLVVALLAAIGAFLLGALLDATGTVTVYGGPRGGLAVVANTAIGAAALHPSVRALTEPQPPVADRLTVLRTVGLGVALAVPPALLVAGTLLDHAVGHLTLAAASLALVPATLLRLHLLARTRDEARHELLVTEQRLLSLIAHTSDTVLLVAPEGRRYPIRFASPASARLLGRDPRELEGQDLLGFVVPDDLDALERALVGRDPLPRRGDVRVRSVDGASHWVEVVADAHHDDDGQPGLVVTLRDITARKRTELRWAEAALRDQLTGVFNRRGIEGWLASELGMVEPGVTVVLACDLDDFKPVNDGHGHGAGDAVLREVARRLRGAVRDGDVVGRVGGDEFVVVCARVDDLGVVGRVAERLTQVVGRPYTVDGVEHRIGVSVGIAVAQPGSTSEQLLDRADAALYAAKSLGKGQVSWAPSIARVG
ncbi:diguanylate cyclase [Nitriliruptoraceae bacterium ZYF776]|nr:diguanylate cyclase [Profundirhabdus halotolerans]